LNGCHSVGHQIEPVILRQSAAYLFGVGEKKGALAQCRKMDLVAALRITFYAKDTKKPAEPFDDQEFLRAVTAIKCLPQCTVAALVKMEVFLALRQIAGYANLMKGVAVGTVEVKERVVGVEKQVGIMAHKNGSCHIV
jgi:hypothetical protein